MDIIGQYQSNIDSIKKEFKLSQYESFYEIFNRLFDAYTKLKQNQSKEIEDGTDTERKRGRSRKTDG